MKANLYFSFFWTLLSGSLFGQAFPEHLLDALHGQQQGNRIDLNWTMSRGVTCINTDVYRSFEGGTFERVYTIGGVCGSLERPENYRFEDTGVQATGTYTYQIVFGTIGEAQLSIDFFRVWEEGWSISYAGGQHLMRVEVAQGPFEVRVLTLAGQELFRAVDIRSSSVILPSSTWPEAVYVVQLSGGGLAFRQKWMLLRPE